MIPFQRNVYLTKKETLSCQRCKRPVKKGERFVAESEDKRGTCFKCSPYVDSTFLKSGDAAMTRRSKKHSSICGVEMAWNARRKRFERRGQYVEAKAIELAKKECEGDAEKRAKSNVKAAIKREAEDKVYISDFSKAIKNRYPNCPKDRETAIAKHACEKYSGRVGRTANAKLFDSCLLYTSPSPRDS